MLQKRIVPVIQISDKRQVKTTRFSDPKYIGDPKNTARIFGEKEVHELILINIDRKLDLRNLQTIAKEVFIPFAYGGGIKDLEDARDVLQYGADKIIISSHANPSLIADLAGEIGSQSVCVSIDYDNHGLVWAESGKLPMGTDVFTHAKEMEMCGAGELILHSMERDGQMDGYDLHTILEISLNVHIPVVALGGCGCKEDLIAALDAGASGAAAGSLFCYQSKENRNVLVNYQNPLRGETT